MIIYWTICEPFPEIYLGLDQPRSVFSDFKSMCPHSSVNKYNANYTVCPAVTDFSKNLYSLKSPMDLEFSWDGNNINFEEEYSRDLIEKILSIRDINGGTFSLSIVPYLFFAESDCEMQYSSPLMVSNSFVDHCTVIPGCYNIGKWFRPTDQAFLIRHQNQKIKINKGDTIANVRFNTKERIEFKKFYFTDQFHELIRKMTRYPVSQKSTLKNYFESMYRDFENSKLRNKILKEIKNNLME
jgi:hypothetical protein